MNAKLWASVVIVMVVLTGTGFLLESSATNQDDKAVLTARVNTIGSGIFVSNDIDPNNLIEKDMNGKVIDFKPNGWKGLIIMTPGLSTIQHMMLLELVTDELGFELRANTDNNPSGDYVFYQITVPGNMKSTFNGNVTGIMVDGGIIWESYYSDILMNNPGGNRAKELFLTGDWKEDHTCCVVAANRTFAENSPGAVSRFLAAYAEAVDWINMAKDPINYPNEYEELVKIVMNYTKISDEAVIKQALINVNYLFELGNLANDISSLVTRFGSQQNILQYTPEELGFANADAFGDWFVDDRYLDDSKIIRADEINDWVSVKLVILTGDIHQIASQVGMVKGFFSKYKVSVTKLEVNNGSDGMKLVLSGNADLGFLGAPPAVINTINMYK